MYFKKSLPQYLIVNEKMSMRKLLIFPLTILRGKMFKLWKEFRIIEVHKISEEQSIEKGRMLKYVFPRQGIKLHRKERMLN